MNYLTSLYNGLSGISSMSQKLNITANNVANANSTGFKTGMATFADVLESLQTANAKREGGSDGR